MANTTDVMAKSVHGTNPQNMVEYIIRQKIYDSFYWKQECFGLTAELLVEKGVELKYAGGMYGDPQKPAEFLCLILKMLQIQPDKDIIIEFIKDEEFKYLRLLGAFYMRLVGRPVDVFQYLEPLYNDFRKVRLRDSYGNFQLSYIDQVVDDMLHKDYCFDIALPRLPARRVLEETGQIEPRVSLLQDEFEAQVELEEKEDAARREREAAEAPGDAKEAGEVGPADQGAGDGRAAIAGSEAKDRESRRRSPSPWRMSERERREDRARKRAAAEVSDEDRRGRRYEEGHRRRHDDDYRLRREDDRNARRYRDDSRDGDRHRRRYRDDSREDRRRASERDGRDRRRRRSRTPSRSPDRHRRRKDQELTKAAETPASEEALEIAEANKLRASLGLKPLRM